MTSRYRLSRRELLSLGLALGSAGALGALIVPNLAELASVSGQPVPDWARRTARSDQAYRAALAEPELMAALPCYCGCVFLSPAHTSLLDCFVKPDGALEQHAAGCETCQDEAIDARELARNRLDQAAIRREIDARYQARGPSTDAPAHR